MAQHDYALADAAGLPFRADLNNVLAAIISQNSGATEPTTTVAYMFWADTTTAIFKQRNAGNSGWEDLYNMTTGQWLGSISGNAATVTVADAAADATTWPMLARSQTGDQAPTTDAGLTYDASTNTLTAGTFTGTFTGLEGSVAANGYQKFTSGLIIQWGNSTSSGTSAGNGTVTLPLSWTGAYLYGGWASNSTTNEFHVMPYTATTTTCVFTVGSANLATSGLPYYWFAIGH